MRPEAEARRAARRIGLLAVQSNERSGTEHNHGHFRLIDARDGAVIAGAAFDLLPADVVRLCEAAGARPVPAGLLRSAHHRRSARHRRRAPLTESARAYWDGGETATTPTYEFTGCSSANRFGLSAVPPDHPRQKPDADRLILSPHAS